jgi:hypothetical protein
VDNSTYFGDEDVAIYAEDIGSRRIRKKDNLILQFGHCLQSISHNFPFSTMKKSDML